MAALIGVSLCFFLFCYCTYFKIISPPPRVFTMAIKVRESGLDSQGNTFIEPYTSKPIKFRDGYVFVDPYWQIRTVFKGNHTFTMNSMYQIRYHMNAPNEPYTLVLSQKVPP